MDAYGIGNSILAFSSFLEQKSRRTGRTTQMLESYKEGDVVIVASIEIKQMIISLARRFGKEIDCRIVPPNEPSRLFDYGTPKGQALFDHTWVEEFYRNELNATFSTLQRLKNEASGYGELHRKTMERMGKLVNFD